MNGRIGRTILGGLVVGAMLLAGSELILRWHAGVQLSPKVVLADGGPTCDQRTVAGTYGFQGQGTLGIGTPQPIPAAETGLATADGVGNLSGDVTFSLAGQILSTPFAGTYQVSSNCTIVETITFGPQVRHQQGVIVGGGKQIDLIDTDPGTVLTRVATRLGGD